MKILCTRPGCTQPLNNFPELDNSTHLKTAQQRYCTSCGMPLILGGRYLPQKLLGKGGFGAAFLAIDRYTPTMKQCVVKQFQPEGNLGVQELELAQQLFEREAIVLEMLGNKHPQIPNLFAYFPLLVPSSPNQPEDQYFYLVQEFIDGQDLETELAQQGRFSEEQTLQVLIEILHILKFVHENNSIHRDIKPSNIMRDKDGVLHLLDFGAVKLVTAGGVNPPGGKSTGIYSMGFAPPEQMTGGEVYPCTDLYALAATCLNLLTGKPTRELYDSYNNKWQWRKFAPDVTDRLGLILDKMLLASPSRRFQSADEVLNTINRIFYPTSGEEEQSQQLKPQKVKPQKIRPQPRPLPLVPILSGAGFIGFESVLLGIALQSALPIVFPVLTGNMIVGIWGGCVGLMIFSLFAKIIEKKESLIVAVISLLLVWYIPLLHERVLNIYQLEMIFLIIIPCSVAIASIMVTALFLLIYKFLRRIF